MWLTSLVRGLGASFTRHADFTGTVIMRVGVVFVNTYQLCSEYSSMLIVPNYCKIMLSIFSAGLIVEGFDSLGRYNRQFSFDRIPMTVLF